MPRLGSRILVVLGAISSASCTDPVHSDAVASLGDEANGVAPGPTHRPGQPCLTCHGGQGPGAPEFAIGGTIYAARGKPQPLPGAVIVLTDANNQAKTTKSNEVGNFYILASDWSPTYPLTVLLQSGRTTKAMNTLIGRNGGCASCHYGADNESNHMPPVFLSEQ